MPATNLTKEAFKQLWQSELLPSIREEVKAEVAVIKESIKALSDRCLQIEKSQEYISSKYDELTQALQSSKKLTSKLEMTLSTHGETIGSIQDSLDNLYNTVDELQQYSRRDCLEISGIAKVPNENLSKVMTELGSIVDVEITEQDISTVHRLPDTAKVKDRMIVKFARRNKRDELYSSRRKLLGKASKDIPSLAKDSDVTRISRIFINESLTSYRKRLFSRINSFRRDHSYKFLWTRNGKIYLKQSEASRSFIFTTDVEFDEFLSATSFS